MVLACDIYFCGIRLVIAFYLNHSFYFYCTEELSLFWIYADCFFAQLVPNLAIGSSFTVKRKPESGVR